MSSSDSQSWFGPYRLVRLLGRGGMGEVYAAEDTRKGRVVALKLISPQFSDDPMFRARMQREAGAAGRMTEAHVVPIHDYGEINGQLYLDMRLIDGTNLAQLLKANGALSPPRAVAIVRQIASALDAAHRSGVTHRDVKPENILVTADDFAYLVDFGIARATTDPGLTRTGTAMGTYKYMAPERFTGNEVTYRSDVYALACVLEECLTGSPPFGADSIERLVAAHLMEPPPRPSQLRPGRVPPALDQVIAIGMAKNPEERYRSAGDLANAALAALTAPDQHQAQSILQQGEQAAAADTMARPGPAGNGVGWRQPAAPPPPDFAPRQPEHRNTRKRWIFVGAAALLLTAVVVAAFLIAWPRSTSTSACGQNVLPFNGLDFRLSPGGVALDSTGNVYVASDAMYGRVVELASGSNTPTALPFTGLYEPQGVAVDSAGTVYVTDFNNRVVKLPAGSNTPTVMPFGRLNYPEGIAVDSADSVYVADRGNNRVLKLAAGSDAPTVLPFTGLNDPDGVAVDTGGNVYVTDSDNHRVLKMTTGPDAQSVLPFTALTLPWGVTVDKTGNVYVTDHDTSSVVKLAAGSNAQTVLPFTDLNTPLAVAADNGGKVYVADRGNDRVVTLSSC